MAALSTQIAVIGAGPGGYAAAFQASDLGKEVVLIDPKPNPGGLCLFHGCIPSKSLLHAAKIIREAGESESLGIKFEKPTIDLDKLRSWKKKIVEQLTGGLGELCKRRKVQYVQGRAVFKDSHHLDIRCHDNSNQELSFEQAIVATGTVSLSLPFIPKDSPRVMNSTTALELDEVPARLLVIGGGYIGLEMGTVYASLGSQVTVVEMMPSLLPGIDRDLVRPLNKRLLNLFDKIMVNTKVVRFDEQQDHISVNFEDATGEQTSQDFDKVLLSIGRKPNCTDLGLEKTKIKINEAGFVEVDENLKTGEPHIYAIGDVAGQPMLAHKATHEGCAVARAMIKGESTKRSTIIPAVVFTDPEIACAGITEDEAKKQSLDVEVIRYTWQASGRALSMDRTEGMTKLIIDRQTERILGVGLVGIGAGELIAEGVLAIEHGIKASELASVIHPHPTLTETVMEAAELFFGPSTHIYKPKRKRKNP